MIKRSFIVSCLLVITANAQESDLKFFKTLSRLVNRKVVIRAGRVITAYPSNFADQKRTLRRGRKKGLMK